MRRNGVVHSSEVRAVHLDIGSTVLLTCLRFSKANSANWRMAEYHSWDQAVIHMRIRQCRVKQAFGQHAAGLYGYWRQLGLAAAYVGLSVVLSVAALFIGLMIARRAFGAAL